MDVGYYGADRNERLVRERIQASWMDAYSPARHLDAVLVVAAMLLSSIGIAMIYSATYHRLELAGLPPASLANKQAVALGIALAAMIATAVFDYRYVRAYAPLLYTGAIFFLLVVLTPFGKAVHGSQSWIDLGGFQLQPSEFAKVALVAALAALLHERKAEPDLTAILAAVGLVAVPTGLILLQPDFGTALVFPWIAFIILLVVGTRARYLVGLLVTAALGVALVLKAGVLADYQIARLTSFLDVGNSELARTTLYNTNQSMIAVGSGGFAGRGFLKGTQTNLSYVPENHNDFIFTVVGEEFGFLGAAVVLGLFAIILWRGLRITALAKDTFGRLAAAGAVAVLSIQMFVNVGMTIGITPVTGIPLPFVSYGGTSLISSFLLVGLLLNVHMRRF
ncbi:MAG: rod shape-determining protein RodA [Actinobacteria bacterium]|nr:rod shape-determining protein RodA [Actinomycetota bacterium]